MRRRSEWARRPIRYEPLAELAGRPHVMVDGAPTLGTVLTLSHWPGTPTPLALRADLSASSALRWRQAPGRWVGADLASTDHLDQDGLMALWALVAPEDALAREDRLVEVARAGDFATFTDLAAARASFALATLADPERSDLPRATLCDPGALTAELLGRVAELVERPPAHAWAEEDAALRASEGDLASGRVALEEVPALDLAVVVMPEDAPVRMATRFMGRSDAACHPAAIHNATECGRVLYCRGPHYELVVRYESWVRLVSRPVVARVDLRSLAVALQAEETEGSVRWSADPVSSLVQRLTVSGASSLPRDRVRQLVIEHLRRAPPAWFPASEGRPSAPPGR